jgi:putative acetyltransferase
MSVEVRATTLDDRDAVLDVVRGAFAPSARGDDEEAQIVAQTWELDAVPDGLDLVADDGGAIVGHVMAARGRLAGKDALGIAPLCVSPAHQRQGIGSALMNEIIDRAELAGWPFLVLLGDPAYYGRFGFEAATTLHIVYEPVGPDSVHFQIKRLQGFDANDWRGTFTYCWELR